MKSKDTVIFDISADKFRYLHREDSLTKRVDIIELNKKLNRIKKSKFYSNTIVVFLLLSTLLIFATISLKF